MSLPISSILQDGMMATHPDQAEAWLIANQSFQLPQYVVNISLFSIRPWTMSLLILLMDRCQHPVGLKRFFCWFMSQYCFIVFSDLFMCTGSWSWWGFGLCSICQENTRFFWQMAWMQGRGYVMIVSWVVFSMCQEPINVSSAMTSGEAGGMVWCVACFDLG